jgi:hypothetical protein
MDPAIVGFLSDPIIAEPGLDMEAAFLLLDRESITSAPSRNLLKTFSWIAAQPDRSTMQKLEAMHKVIEFARARQGTHCVIPSLRKFLDWPAP